MGNDDLRDMARPNPNDSSPEVPCRLASENITKILSFNLQVLPMPLSCYNDLRNVLLLMHPHMDHRSSGLNLNGVAIKLLITRQIFPCFTSSTIFWFAI